MKIIYEPRGRAREYAPLSCNLYSGCEHGCRYCYAPAVSRKSRDEFAADVKPRVDILRKLEADLCECVDRASIMPPVLLCFMCDAYTPSEARFGVTREAIRAMKGAGLTVEVLTKNGPLAARDFDLLTPQDAHAATLTFLDDDASRKWEPGAALPSDRIEALKLAKRHGIRTWVSLEPVIDPVQTLEIIKRTHSFVDKFKVGKVNHMDISVDWRRFGLEVKCLLDDLGCDHYIKRDLLAFMGKGET